MLSKKTIELIKDFSLFVYLLIFSTIFMSLIWLFLKFGKVSLDQFLIHLEIIFFNQIGNDVNLRVTRYSKYWLLYLPLLISLILFTIVMIIKYFNKLKKIKFLNEILLKFKRNYFKIVILITIPTIIFLFFFLTNFFEMSRFLFQSKISLNENKDYFYENFYQTKISHKKKNNLIVIYVESFDTLFSNKKIFKENLLDTIYKNLDNNGGQVLFKLRSTPGANWTSASLVATQCGIPLKPLGLNQKNLILSKSFLKNHMCISDYLNELGNYHTEFISGSPLNFSNMYGFLKSHKYNKIYGKKELLEEGYEENPSGWSQSISDKNTFNFLKKRILHLEKKNSSYFINLLTIDTHKPGVFYDKSVCLNTQNNFIIKKNNVLYNSKFFKKFKKNFNLDEIYRISQVYNQVYDSGSSDLNDLKIAVKCTTNIINDFINFFKKNNFKNTSLFIVGDHEYFMLQNEYKNRYIFNAYIGNKDFNVNQNEILQYDLYPFFLKLLGFSLESERQGFGIYPIGSDTLNMSERLDNINKSIILKSEFYKKLW